VAAVSAVTVESVREYCTVGPRVNAVHVEDLLNSCLELCACVCVYREQRTGSRARVHRLGLTTTGGTLIGATRVASSSDGVGLGTAN